MVQKKTKSSHSNPQAVAAKLSSMRKGLATVFTADKPLEIAGQTSTAGQVVAEFDQDLTLFDAVDTTHTAFTTAVNARSSALSGILVRMANVENVIRALIGTSSQSLKQFGLKPKSPRAKRTTTAKAASATKAAATRKAHAAAADTAAATPAPTPGKGASPAA